MIYFVIFLILLLLLFIYREKIFTYFGNFYIKKNDIDNAVKVLGFGEKLGRMSINYRLNFAYLLLKTGNISEANKIFSLISLERIKDDEKNKLSEYQALLHHVNGDISKAIEFYEEVLQNAPNVSVYESLGSLYIQNGNLATALEFNKNAFEKYNQNSKILNNLAYTYLCISDYLNTREYYNKLFMMKPDFPECYFEYGRHLVETGYIKKGLNYMKKALDFEFNKLSPITKDQVEEYIKEKEKAFENLQENFQDNTLDEENNVSK